MEISERVLDIVRLLCESDELHMKAGEIADALGVSSKTVSRDLPQAELLLEKYGLRLEKKAGTGLWLEGGSKGFAALQSFLEKHPKAAVYTPEERRSIIMSCILPSEEPVKLFALASRLKVTDGTISNDLDKLEPWFKEHSLRLVRKPGLGVYVEGEEQDVRRAMVRYIYENMDQRELLNLVQRNLNDEQGKPASGTAGYLLELVDKEIIVSLEAIVRSAEGTLGYHLSDNAFIGLVVHLSLAVGRIRKHDRIRMDETFLEELKQKKEFQPASILAEEIEKAFEITVPDDEIGYITMHLLGARNRYREKSIGTVSVMDNFHLVRLAKSIMKTASREAGRDVTKNQNLLAGLVNHLGPSISRIKMGMDIRNPLLSEIKEHYPELMELSLKSVKELEKELGKALPESEVAYIAMHLGAALADSEEFRHVEHSVVVACPTGMGTSRLLASRIRKQYSNIRIVDQISTLSIDDTYAKQQEVDFVISTVPIPTSPIPVVVVSPVLGENDMRLINSELQRQNEYFLRDAVRAERKGMGFREALECMTEYDTAILQLLRNFFFEKAEAGNIEEACRIAGHISGADESMSEKIFKCLLERETKSPTVLTGNRMVMLHCKCPCVDELRLGIIHFGKGFPYSGKDGERVQTALVLLAPQNASDRELETIGYIASILLDRWGLIEVLHEGSRVRIEGELVKLFREFYRNKYKELMEG